MRQLKDIRIFLATLFFVASAAYLIIGPGVHPMAVVSLKLQIIPSLLAVTMGVTAIWLVITFLFGRIYCSTVCPVGTLLDCFIPLRKRLRFRKINRPFRYKKRSSAGFQVLVVYIVCLIIPIVAVPALIEPWNIMRNISTIFNLNPANEYWVNLGYGAATGIIAGVASLLLLFIAAIFTGRDFCNNFCPIGTALGLFNDKTLYRIEIDPDRCTSCMKCEYACKASCIKVIGSYVDNSRCVRCFDCIAECEEDAIRYQINRNMRHNTPLMRKVKSPGVK